MIDLNKETLSNLQMSIGSEKVSTRLIDRLALCRDASLYRLVPQVIVRPTSTLDVVNVLRWCAASGMHATFRAAGTSLSGQAVTDGVLIDISRNWWDVSITEKGDYVTVQPGVTGGRVNALLKRYGRKLGPDPASINAAMIGGIVANNASGMCCGTAQNSYNTIEHLIYTLPDGTTINTANPDSDEQLLAKNKTVYNGIVALRREVLADTELTATIRKKYAIKNTMGYSLNAFLDEEQPSKILGRLMIGSEGTLGFVSSVTYRTIPDAPFKLTSLLVFASIEEACSHIDYFRNSGAAAIELMDDACLASFASLESTPITYRFHGKGLTALLVEFHFHSADHCHSECLALTEALNDIPTINQPTWTNVEAEQMVLWRLRKGLMPTVGAMRSSGDTMINEDIAVPPRFLPSLISDVQLAFNEYGYHGAIIFGHAKDGNIHFVLNQNLSTEASLVGYDGFMRSIADIVVSRYGGSLKAEHGTGRNMAPFVQMEWGARAYSVMKRLKILVDPNGVLSPDVILSDDPDVHIKHIKPIPSIHGQIDACIECGFCEHVCPTRNTHTTPRQRIALQRELQLASGNSKLFRQLTRDFNSVALDSCAADSVCGLVCPVGIDTGAYVKSMRAMSHNGLSRSVTSFLGKHYGVIDRSVKFFASTAIFASSLVKRLSPVIGQMGSSRAISQPIPNDRHVDAIVFAGCPSRWFSTQDGGHSHIEKMIILANRAGLNIEYMQNDSVCCGQPFDSSGFPDAAATAGNLALELLYKKCLRNNTPIIVDTSTCLGVLKRIGNAHELYMISEADFLYNQVLPRLQISNRLPSVTIHAGCGVHKNQEVELVNDLVKSCTHHPQVLPTFCCGMAGDHGVKMPEILRGSVDNFSIETGSGEYFVTCNTTCQAGLSYSVGKKFMSLTDMLLKVSATP